ncbi:MAG: Holliday junction resolvase YqgF, partial [Candidatus Woesebacteria bacterium GW2011_GWB1_38_5]
MKYLGIDYGRKKIGLAVSDGVIAEPLRILRYEDIRILREKLGKIISEFGIQKIVIGISEGEMGRESKEFGRVLEEKIKTPVIYQDESLSTQTAQELSIGAGIKR